MEGHRELFSCDGNIRNVEFLNAHQTESVHSRSECKYVIEVSKENFGKIQQCKLFDIKGNMITFLQCNPKRENFGNSDFQKIANSVYKTVR